MGQRVEVLSVETKSGIGKKSGAQYSMDVCQCVLSDGDKKLAGELILPKDHPKLAPGFYSPVFTMIKSFDGKLAGVVSQLVPEASIRKPV